MNKFPLLWVLALGLLTTPTAFGQSRFSLAPTVGYASRTLNTKIGTYDSDWRITTATRYTGYNVGLTGHYAITPKWSVSIGLQYSRLTGGGQATTFRADSLLYSTNINGRLARLQMPVLVNYTGSAHRLSPYLSAGILLDYNYPLSDRLDWRDALQVQATVGAGLLYRFTSRMSLIVQPTLGYKLGKPTDNILQYSDYRPLQVGIQAQVKFSF